MHRFLGVCIPDDIVSDGAQAVVEFTNGLLRQYNELFQEEPLTRHFTRTQVWRMAIMLGVPVDDLPGLAVAVAKEFVDPLVIAGVGGEPTPGFGVRVGVDKKGLYLYSFRDVDPRRKCDGYAIGGRYYGQITRAASKTTKQQSHLRLDTQVRSNLAPVEEILSRIVEQGEPHLDAVLRADGGWRPEPLRRRRNDEPAACWAIWHLRRFRLEHHVLGVDYTGRDGL